MKARSSFSSMAQEPETYYNKGEYYNPDCIKSNHVKSEGLKVIERFFEVPLDHSNPSGDKIRVFARNLVPRTKAKTKEEEEKLPYCAWRMTKLNQYKN